MATVDDVLGFWFRPAPATNADEFGVKMKRWYRGGDAEDAAIRERFADTVERALAGRLDGWAATPRGRVALIVLLDQMTRCLFRGSPRAFAGDAKAQRLATEILDAGGERALDWEERHFLYMPLLHAEDAALLDRFNEVFPRTLASVPEWARPLLSDGIEQGHKYRDLVARFGRFPHRNAALGRTSTPAEVEFLKTWDARARPKTFVSLFGPRR
jgi:uncharacterized protein (DUF924 family)